VWTCTTYDTRGRTVKIVYPPDTTYPTGRTVTTTYDVGGDPYTTAVTDPAGTITTTVDALGRPVKTVDVWGVTTVNSYDVAGRVTSTSRTMTSPAYTTTSSFTIDDVGRLVRQQLDGNTNTQNTYTPTRRYSTLAPSQRSPTRQGPGLLVTAPSARSPSTGTDAPSVYAGIPAPSTGR
jgi:YD repeat-containing protein